MYKKEIRKTRNTTDDLIRLISATLVIINHTDNKPWNNVPILGAMMTTMVLFCNSFFFMLSGKYSIKKEFNTPEDYLEFYKTRAINVLFPYVLVSMILSAWDLSMLPDSYIIGGRLVYYFKYAFKQLLNENVYTHLWFMFFLVVFIACAPFLSKMFHAMDDWELHIIFGFGIAWNTIKVLIFPLMQETFSYSGWFLDGWIFHFCMGYYIYRILNENNAKWFYLAGMIGLVLNVVGMTFAQDRFKNPTDLAPTFMLACAGAMSFLSRSIRIKNERMTKAIGFVANHSFVLYMVHFSILHVVTPIITHGMPDSIRFVADVMVTFVISLICAWILHFVIDPCKTVLKHLLRV